MRKELFVSKIMLMWSSYFKSSKIMVVSSGKKKETVLFTTSWIGAGLPTWTNALVRLHAATKEKVKLNSGWFIPEFL